MKLNNDEQVLYDFFVTFGVDPHNQEVINAYCSLDGLDKPLYEAIKENKGWK